MRISDWSSDVCSSDLPASAAKPAAPAAEAPPVSTPAAAAPVAPTAEVAEPKRRGPKPGFKRAAKVQPAPSDVAPIRDEDISDPRFKGIDPWLAKRISLGLAEKPKPKDRKGVGEGKSVSVGVDIGGSSSIKNKQHNTNNSKHYNK